MRRGATDHYRSGGRAGPDRHDVGRLRGSTSRWGASEVEHRRGRWGVCPWVRCGGWAPGDTELPGKSPAGLGNLGRRVYVWTRSTQSQAKEGAMEGLGAGGRGSGPALGSRGLRRRAVPLVGLLLLTASLALAARAEAFVYWAHPGDVNGSPAGIERANLDGSGVEESFIPDARRDAGRVAVDGEHVYWGRPWPARSRAPTSTAAGVDLNFIPLEVRPEAFAGVGGRRRARLLERGARVCGWRRQSDAPTWTAAALTRTHHRQRGAACGLAVDGEHIYWERRRWRGVMSIARANLDGTGVDQSFIRVPPTSL